MTEHPVGWYADPMAPGTGAQRYWDGLAWTQYTRATTPPPTAPSQALAHALPRALPGRRGGTTGRELLAASWDALKQDKELLLLPVLGAVTSTLAVLVIVAVGWFAGLGSAMLASSTGTQGHGGIAIGGLSVLGWLAAVVLGYVTTAIAVFFQVALVAGAMERMDGGSPTLSGALSAAASRLPQILLWSLIAATVGMLLRAVSERSGLLGRLVIGLVGLAWSVVTFFAVPIIMVEGNGSFSAISRSRDLMLATWGKVARSGLRFGFVFLLPYLACIAVIALGVGVAAATDVVLGVAIAAVGVIGLIAVSLLVNAVGTYLRTALYRYAVGMPVPTISAHVLAGAIRTTG